MKKQTHKQERGAIIIEIIAVIALLGVMGPLLFKQISDRNEEVENINIATEVRIVKEALSSYILSHHADLVNECNQSETLSTTVAHGALEQFLPTGFEDLTQGYKLTILLDKNSIGNNRLSGYIVPDLDALGLPQMNIRRVARIANLIGADGGIFINNQEGEPMIHGTGGAWELEAYELEDLPNEHTFVATTGMDTYVPTVNFEDFDPSNILLPDNLGLGRFHAWDFFSVGGPKEGPGSCFELKHNTATGTTATNDVIYEAGTNGCAPLFWVGSSTREAIPSGDVFVKQKLHLRESPNSPSSITLSSGNEITASTNEERNKARNIKVFDINGKEIINIDATGKIDIVGKTPIPLNNRVENSGEYEKLTIQNGRIDSNVLAPNAESDIKLNENPGIKSKSVNYSVDPRYTSVMNDIRLESRGGARLSDLLPTYSLKDIKTIEAAGKSSDIPQAIEVPGCPKNHKPAIMVTPVSWHQYTENDVINTVVSNVRANADGSLRQNTTPTPETQAPLLPRVTITYSDQSDEDYTQSIAERSGGAWNVSLTYVRNDVALDTDIPTPIKAIVHTYCLYQKPSEIPPVRPETEK